MRWATILLAALAVLGTAGLAAPSAAFGQQSGAPTTAPATQPTADQIDLSDPLALGRALNDPAITADQREFAAHRLVALGSQPAIDELIRALRPDAPQAVHLAAASAISSAALQEPRLIEPLLSLLAAEGPVNVKREIGRALSTFRESQAVAGRLAELAVSNSPVSTRQGAVAGLARIPAKSSAQALMVLLDGDAPEALEREAADALRILTGRNTAPDDLAGWQQWWAGASQLDETAFKAQLLDERAADSLATARRAESAAAALFAASQQRYRALAAPERTSMLAEYLRSPSAELREVAVRLVLVEEVNLAHDVPPEVMRLVRAGIIDSDPRVRSVAAQIARFVNDSAAAEPLLAQVVRETSPPARLDQIRALGSLRDERALVILLGLMSEPSPAVRTASARAAVDVADAVGDRAVSQTSSAIRQVFEATDASTRSGQRQRAELMTALADLKDPTLVDFYRRLLSSPGPLPREVLVPALRGVATLGDTRLNELANRYVSPANDSAVREQAIRALGRTSVGFERQLDFRRLMQAPDSPEGVRRVAWEALVELFPKAKVNELDSLVTFLRDLEQHDRQLLVMRAIVEKLQAEGNFKEVAFYQHQMAETLMNELDRPGDAAEIWQAALAYSLENGPAATLQTRAENALKCYLRARRFEEAIIFAREMIDRDPTFVQSVGTLVKREADTFAKDGQPQDARTLIDAILRQDPPLLDPRSRSQLEQQRDALPTTSSAG